MSVNIFKMYIVKCEYFHLGTFRSMLGCTRGYGDWNLQLIDEKNLTYTKYHLYFSVKERRGGSFSTNDEKNTLIISLGFGNF